jgi:hypothetical protein
LSAEISQFGQYISKTVPLFFGKDNRSPRAFGQCNYLDFSDLSAGTSAPAQEESDHLPITSADGEVCQLWYKKESDHLPVISADGEVEHRNILPIAEADGKYT